MAKLNGSGKQIALAEAVREIILNGSIGNQGINDYIDFKNKQIDSNDEELKDISDSTEIEEITEENKIYKNEIALFLNLKNRVELETSSVWFIENQSNGQLFGKEVFNK